MHRQQVTLTNESSFHWICSDFFSIVFKDGPTVGPVHGRSIKVASDNEIASLPSMKESQRERVGKRTDASQTPAE